MSGPLRWRANPPKCLGAVRQNNSFWEFYGGGSGDKSALGSLGLMPAVRGDQAEKTIEKAGGKRRRENTEQTKKREPARGD